MLSENGATCDNSRNAAAAIVTDSTKNQLCKPTQAGNNPTNELYHLWCVTSSLVGRRGLMCGFARLPQPKLTFSEPKMTRTKVCFVAFLNQSCELTHQALRPKANRKTMPSGILDKGRYANGIVALREIRRYQKSTHLLIQFVFELFSNMSFVSKPRPIQESTVRTACSRNSGWVEEGKAAICESGH